MNKLISFVALSALLTACDAASRRDRREEREDRIYRAAMDDYRAGRLDAAVKGFGKVLRGNPANASARFQLACLLQDSKKDYLGAFCGYREFLDQQPESDKASLVRDRLALCEKELAKTLAAKYGLSAATGLSEELAAVRKELQKSRTHIAATEKNFEAAQLRVRSLLAERDRLLAIVKGGDVAEEGGADRPSVREAKDLLEEEDASEAPKAPDDIARIREDEASVKPAVPDDVAKLREEAKADLAASAIPLVKKSAVSVSNKVAQAASPKAKPPARPKTYKVAEGDSLYGVAKRFYGTSAAWKLIRNANKTLISTDNRLRVGDTIVLP